MYLYLIDDWLDLGIAEQILQMMPVEVAYTQRTDLALLDKFFHYTPCLRHTVFHGPMYEQQVQIAGLQLLHTIDNLLADVVGLLAHINRAHLGCEEDLFARCPALGYTLTHCCLIVISLCRVDMSEPSPKCQLDILAGHFVFQGLSAHTHLWNGMSVTKLDERH